jgi:hypothetical protein
MVTASFISRLSRAVDAIEKRRRQNRPFKVVEVQRRVGEDRDAAQVRHFAAHRGCRRGRRDLPKFATIIGSITVNVPCG